MLKLHPLSVEKREHVYTVGGTASMENYMEFP